MSLEDIKKSIDGINDGVETMRSKFEEEIKSLKEEHKSHKPLTDDDLKSKVDGLTKEFLAKCEDDIAQLEKKNEQLEIAYKRKQAEQAGDEVLTDEQKKQQDLMFGEKGYYRKGDVAFQQVDTKAMSTLSDPQGGFFVPVATSDKIVRTIRETSPMRNHADQITITTGSIEGPTDLNEVTAQWVGETETRSETTTPDVGMWRIDVHELHAKPKITQTILDDAGIDIEAFLSDKVSRKFARTENSAFINGNGVNKPRGILTYPAGTSYKQIEQVNMGHATLVTDDGVINLEDALKTDYRVGASYFMKRQTKTKLRLLKDGFGRYLWQPNFQQGEPETLNGYPIALMDDMPAVGAGALALAFGNMRIAYLIVDRAGIRILRDPYTANPFILLDHTKRVGGDILDFEALKIGKISA